MLSILATNSTGSTCGCASFGRRRQQDSKRRQYVAPAKASGQRSAARCRRAGRLMHSQARGWSESYPRDQPAGSTSESPSPIASGYHCVDPNVLSRRAVELAGPEPNSAKSPESRPSRAPLSSFASVIEGKNPRKKALSLSLANTTSSNKSSLEQQFVDVLEAAIRARVDDQAQVGSIGVALGGDAAAEARLVPRGRALPGLGFVAGLHTEPEPNGNDELELLGVVERDVQVRVRLPDGSPCRSVGDLERSTDSARHWTWSCEAIHRPALGSVE